MWVVADASGVVNMGFPVSHYDNCDESLGFRGDDTTG